MLAVAAVAAAAAAAAALPPAGARAERKLRQRFIYNCVPRVHCKYPDTDNFPCLKPTIPVFVKPPVPISVAEHKTQSTLDGQGYTAAYTTLRRDIFDTFASLGAFENRFALNFGAWLQTPTQILWYDTATGLMTRRGWQGMAFDAASHLVLLRRLLKARQINNVTLHEVLLSSSTVGSYLEKHKVPKDLDFLKVDIDSFDCDLAEAILGAGYRPAMFQIETSQAWPPGVRATARPGRTGGPYGCSCAAGAELGRRYGYRLLSGYGFDVTMVHLSLLKRLEGRVKLHTAGYCSADCGTAYCMRNQGVCATRAEKWQRMAEAGRWDELTMDAARAYQQQGWRGDVSNDFGTVRVSVTGSGSSGLHVSKDLEPELRREGKYAVPTASSGKVSSGAAQP